MDKRWPDPFKILDTATHNLTMTLARRRDRGKKFLKDVSFHDVIPHYYS